MYGRIHDGRFDEALDLPILLALPFAQVECPFLGGVDHLLCEHHAVRCDLTERDSFAAQGFGGGPVRRVTLARLVGFLDWMRELHRHRAGACNGAGRR